MSSNRSSSKEKQREEAYQQLIKKHRPKPKVFTNCLKAFVVGGLICIMGQALMLMYIKVFGFQPDKAGDPTSATLIFISCLLTGIGVYDRIGQWAGAGTAVPVTGFANSIASSALEHRAEGWVLGVGGNMFKLAGAVIVFGTVSAFIIGIIHTLMEMIK
ncbi:stage V sporulation protein AC [Paenactinomyces guangxiensis]|uniref:Stage V sporulation protein AC n=1 Tax=Paenactinomyces guangxiensis TaxID=1490290 RepID=A0A7W1WMZ5_9BACL|nr:stage V sporulation protein AC [Paenactinomyces guangxiensis]MBA4492893.1 stage V sporulation protein AC [Paenactinomyces guangxiensis]MBH8590259.1 stage V sporulation protein AC [Paenactinomyces guangxiensis]